jgi:hypothetical protein
MLLVRMRYLRNLYTVLVRKLMTDVDGRIILQQIIEKELAEDGINGEC